jgi:hypothetical protein
LYNIISINRIKRYSDFFKPFTTLFNSVHHILFFFFLLSFFQFSALWAQQPAFDSILKLIPSRVMTTRQVELIAGRTGGSYQERMQSIEK